MSITPFQLCFCCTMPQQMFNSKNPLATCALLPVQEKQQKTKNAKPPGFYTTHLSGALWSGQVTSPAQMHHTQ